MRKEAGLTQRELATRFKREQSFVWRIETGERRLDLVEFFWVCRAMGCNAGARYNELSGLFETLDISDDQQKSLKKRIRPSS